MDSAGVDAEPDDDDGDAPSLGLMIDAGLPDGAMAAVGYRPLSWIRLQAGAGTNSISPGVRLGASLIPFGVGPSLSLEAGHYFEGDANELARKLSGSGFEDTAVLERIGYDFANVHLGLELGGDYVVFFAHGGFSYVRTTIHNVNELLGEQAGEESTTTVSINQDPTIVGFVPSAKLGLAVFFM